MFASRPICVPLSAVAAASLFPKQSSGLPLLSGLCFDGRLLEMAFVREDFSMLPPNERGAPPDERGAPLNE